MAELVDGVPLEVPGFSTYEVGFVSSSFTKSSENRMGKQV